MNNITIAIDGFSSTGKSTIAKQLAQHLGYVYVDSGAMYRAVSLYAIQNGFISENNFNKANFIKALHKIKLGFVFNPNMGFSEIYLNGINVEKEIRTMEVSSVVSKVSEIPEVRHKLVYHQQNMRKQGGIVMDGRDIGTVVFPQAELKIFMTASPEIRAQRRYDELVKRGDIVIYEEVLRNVNERDYIDSHRKNSPLKKTEDAIEIDNSNLSLDEQFTQIMNLVKTALRNKE
jgi:CMP/dCMP kinase